MAPRYKTWDVSVYTAPTVAMYRPDGSLIVDRVQTVVEVVEPPRRPDDPDPLCVWVVTLDDDGEIESLKIDRAGAGAIDQKTLDSIPLGYLRDIAAAEVARFKAGEDTQAGIRFAGGDAGPPLTGSNPTSAEFAAVWNATLPRTTDEDGNLIPRREALAAHWCVPLWRIDEWTRAARKHGLIGKPTTGRPSKKKESEK